MIVTFQCSMMVSDKDRVKRHHLKPLRPRPKQGLTVPAPAMYALLKPEYTSQSEMVLHFFIDDILAVKKKE